MLKLCVVCGDEFDARGRAKTCGNECSKEYKRQWHANYRSDPVNKEHHRKWGIKHRANPVNKEYVRQYFAEYYAIPVNKKRIASHRANPVNKERISKYNAEYYAIPVNKKRIRQNDANYRSDPLNKERKRIHMQNRAARKRELPNSLTPEQWQYAVAYWNGCCAVCGRQLKDLFNTHTASGDHWVPLSYEGEDNPGTVAWNIVPLCLGIDGCNNSKSNTMPHEWLTRKYGNSRGDQIFREIETFLAHMKEVYE